ncbi:MAG: transposase [Thermoguttaceae bacterium]
MSQFVNKNGKHELQNTPHTPFAQNLPKLTKYIETQMKARAVLLTASQAEELLLQMIETSNYRNWNMAVAAIMANHFHVVVESPKATEYETLLKDIKSYGSRRLNAKFGERRWWTSGGSARPLYTDTAIQAAMRYVLNQSHPLIRWSKADGVLK